MLPVPSGTSVWLPLAAALACVGVGMVAGPSTGAWALAGLTVIGAVLRAWGRWLPGLAVRRRAVDATVLASLGGLLGFLAWTGVLG